MDYRKMNSTQQRAALLRMKKQDAAWETAVALFFIVMAGIIGVLVLLMLIVLALGVWSMVTGFHGQILGVWF